MSDVSAPDFIPHVKCPHRSQTTGSWRSFKPVIDQQTCNRCLSCWIFCPEGAIKQGSEGLLVDLDYCKGCGICASECRKDAIRMVEDVPNG